MVFDTDLAVSICKKIHDLILIARLDDDILRQKQPRLNTLNDNAYHIHAFTKHFVLQHGLLQYVIDDLDPHARRQDLQKVLQLELVVQVTLRLAEELSDIILDSHI